MTTLSPDQPKSDRSVLSAVSVGSALERAKNSTKSGPEPLDYPLWPALVTFFLHFTAFNASGPLYVYLFQTSYDAMEGLDFANDPTAPAKMAAKGNTAYSMSFMLVSFLELVSSGIIGVLCDRVGRRPMAISTQIGQLFEFGIAAFCALNYHMMTPKGPISMKGTITFMFIARSIAGLLGNVKVPVIAYVADISTAETSAKNFGLLMAAFGFSTILGPFLITVIVPAFGLGGIYATSFCLATLNNLFIFFMWPRYAPPNKAEWKDAVPCFLVKSTLGTSKSLMMYGVMNFFDNFALFMVFATIGPIPGAIFGPANWQPAQVGYFMMLFGFATLLANTVFLKTLLLRVSEINVLKFGYVASCLAYAVMWLLGFASSPQSNPGILYIGVIPLALGMVSNPIQTGLATREISWDMVGRLSGAYSVFETIGKICAPLVSAPVFAATLTTAPETTWIVASCILLPAVAMSFGVGYLIKDRHPSAFEAPGKKKAEPNMEVQQQNQIGTEMSSQDQAGPETVGNVQDKI